MANDVFELSQDVDVSIYTYDADAFIWDVSRWDGGDKWSSGSETETWQPIICEVSYIRTSNGVTVEQGLTSPEPATATIVYQSVDYDPFTNSQVRSGTPIIIKVRPNPDTFPDSWVTLFQGKIQTASASYSHDWINTITLECSTELRDYLNFTALDGLATANPCYAGDYFNAMNIAYGSTFVETTLTPEFFGYELEGINEIDPVQFGAIVNNLLNANLGALVYSPIVDSTFYYFYTWDELANRTLDPNVEFESEPSANPLRAEFSNITLGFDTAEVVNTVNFTTTLGYANTVENSASISLLGSLALDIETIHYNDADADDWAARISLALPQRRVQQVEAPVILRAGQVNENLLRDPFDVARVTANNSRIVIDETYYITRVEHELTPFSWNAVYDLWKGR